MNELAAKRDVAALLALSRPDAVRPTAFDFLRTGGVYGGGRSGWTAHELSDADGQRKYAVFSTEMTCEDIGEQVFEWKPDGLGSKVEERYDFGLHLDTHDFVIRMDPAASKVMIEDTVTFRSTGPAQKSFQVRLGPEWRVTQVKNGSDQIVKYNQAAGTVSILRPSGDQFALKFTYEAVLDKPEMEGKMRSDEMMLSGACWWPSLARQASKCKTTIISPPDWRSFGHGARIKETLENGLRVTTWDNQIPISVLSAASGRYKIRLDKYGTKTFWTAAIDEVPEEFVIQNEVNAGIIGFYETLAKWPYPSWGSLISSRMVGGALEAYSFATYAKGWLPDIDPHETAHTFFGGVIPNTYLRSLWNESFASYFEQYYFREGVPGNRADLRLAFRDIPLGMPVFKAQAAATAGAETGSSASAIGYGRGGLVLDMLEHEIGEVAMKESIRTWLREHQPGKTGEWEDFERIVIRVSKRDIRWFFDQWLRKPGYSEFEITDTSLNQSKAGWEVAGTLRFNGTPYRLRLEALVEGDKGESQLIKLPLSSGKSSEVLKVQVPFRPRAITFDPWHRIMRNVDSASYAPNLRRSMQGRTWVRGGDEEMGEQLLGARPRTAGAALPTNLNRMILIADPRKNAEFSELLKKIPNGPIMQGSRIVWRGQSVDISKGGFAGVLELPDNQRCVLMFGHSRLTPQLGQANGVLFDDLGRPLAATRLPSRSGELHFDLQVGS
ncbi:MAG: hypothetical protein JNK63_03610 [Chthonomonas sp.]|nr:hypothetical protein [Chthonomonas sp.]